MPARLTAQPKPFYPSPAERVFGAADKIGDFISPNYYCISTITKKSNWWLYLTRLPNSSGSRTQAMEEQYSNRVLITGSCLMIIPLSNDLLLNICLWLLFDSNELFIVQPPTRTTAPTALTLKSIVPLKPACLLLIWVIATSSRKGFGPIIHIP